MTAARAGRPRRTRSRWRALVEKHEIMLASARGPVPNVAEAVAGEPIIGSWWAHPKGRAIFAALSELAECDDVRSFKLIDGKLAFVHRRAWPALVRLAEAGVLARDQVAAVQQVHTPTGKHRNVVTPFPEWVDDGTARAARKMGVEEARAALLWLQGGKAGKRSERPGGGTGPARRSDRPVAVPATRIKSRRAAKKSETQ
jgi:hypothetical protein